MARTSKTVVAGEKRPQGGQTLYDPDIASQIVQRIAQGEPLRKICRSEGYPNWRTVYLWIETHAAFAAQVAQARDLGQDAIAEDLLDVAAGREGSTGDILRDKLLVETSLKLLKCWNPKKYGDVAAVQINDNRQQVVMVMPRTGGDRVIEADIIDALPPPEDAG